MDEFQEQFCDATFAFSQGKYGQAAAGFEAILAVDENNFDARMSLSMALCRREQYERASEEGHKAEKLSPTDLHLDLSLGEMTRSARTATTSVDIEIPRVT